MPYDLCSHFNELSDLLRRHDIFWRPVAFHDSRLPWRDRYPALAEQLLALPPIEVEALCNDNEALFDFLVPVLPFVSTLRRLCELPSLPRYELPVVDARFYAGIPGRKWQQVEQFASRVMPADLPILEWCAGKSHLGFLLQRCSNQPVTALEWNADLVAQANLRAERWQVPLQSLQQDVLQPSVCGQLHAGQYAVALHACGDLHEQLLRLGVQQQVRAMAVAPCCYHKIAADTYRPLSQQAQNLALPLGKPELHLAVMETVTAGHTVRRQREQFQAMRLGFDCLQREVRGVDAFLPVPSLPARWGRLEFSDFCQQCADLKGIDLPDNVDWHHYLQLGMQRFREVAALDLVRLLFRRPLEIWLGLDRALFLQEQGYQVQLGTFCDARITPRNLMLLAQIPS